MISFGKVEGVIQDAGNAVTVGLLTVYTFIEITDGQVLRYVAVSPSLHGKLSAAIRSKKNVEIYLGNNPKGKDFKATVLGIKIADGKLYAQNLAGGADKIVLFMIVFGFMGVILMPVFLVGLFPLFLCYQTFKSWRIARKTESYVRSLPDALYV